MHRFSVAPAAAEELRHELEQDRACQLAQIAHIKKNMEYLRVETNRIRALSGVTLRHPVVSAHLTKLQLLKSDLDRFETIFLHSEEARAIVSAAARSQSREHRARVLRNRQSMRALDLDQMEDESYADEEALAALQDDIAEANSVVERRLESIREARAGVLKKPVMSDEDALSLLLAPIDAAKPVTAAEDPPALDEPQESQIQLAKLPPPPTRKDRAYIKRDSRDTGATVLMA